MATVLVTEGVEFDLDTLDTYVKATYPDLRKCLNLVQPNSQSGTLVQPNAADKSAKDWKLDCVELFKAGHVREARTVLCQSADAEESNEIFRWMYDNLDLWTATPEQQAPIEKQSEHSGNETIDATTDALGALALCRE